MGLLTIDINLGYNLVQSLDKLFDKIKYKMAEKLTSKQLTCSIPVAGVDILRIFMCSVHNMELYYLAVCF